MTFMQSVLLFALIFICVYSVINRLCQCIEHCASAKAFAKYTENNKDEKNHIDVIE